MITVDALDDPGVRHAFFTRAGGVSEGIYASLNCGFGSGDEPQAVAENRARAMAMLDQPADALATVYQVHGTAVVAVDAIWPRDAAPRADGLVTDRPGLALGVLSADCAPLLFADAEARVVGAAHAGWRGALAGVAEATIAAMCRIGAEPARIAAAIGPSIGPDSYEVGPELRDAFLAAAPENGRWFTPVEGSDRLLFDLPGYIAARLGAAGLRRIACVRADTCIDPERFFSYRRACKAGEPDYGRGLSAIVLT